LAEAAEAAVSVVCSVRGWLRRFSFFLFLPVRFTCWIQVLFTKEIPMRFRSSLAAAMAAAVTAVVFTAASQPVEAAIFTWQSASNTAWATGTSWQGNAAPTAGNELVFGAAGVGSARTANQNLGNGFIVNGLSFTGTTNYTLNGSSIELRGDITNSTNLMTLNLPVTTNKGSTVNIVTSGTIQSTSAAGYITSPDGLALSGGGKWILRGGATADISTAAGTTLEMWENGSGIEGDLTANGITRFGTADTNFVNSFTAGATSQTFLGVRDETDSAVGLNGQDLGATATFGGLLSLDFAAIVIDPATLTNGTQIGLFDNAGGTTNLSYSGNFSSLVATGTSTLYPTAYGPVVGAWTLDGGNWRSPNIANGASPVQYFEFQPSTGSLVVVPEPTQMVLVAGVGAALGMWRMRKLRRNGRGSDATEC
jgi:hypothetical protein